MYKVLIFGMTENPGGVESFVMNYLRQTNDIEFDFLCNTLNNIAYEDEILQMNSKVYHIPSLGKNPFRYFREVKKFFKNHSCEYDAIWVNLNSLANIDYIKLAKKYGLKRIILHSHNSQNMEVGIKGMVKSILHHYNRKKVKLYATDFWACSEEAGKFFYDDGDELLTKVKIIPNAIPVEKTAFSSTKRMCIRKKLGIEEDTYVLGNVGRLQYQKNQEFMIEVFYSLEKRLKKSRLILVGDGPDKEKLVSKVTELHLEDKVIFAGIQRDIQAYLSAFDLFFFPSRFEGLSIAALEAQANGVPILSSEGVVPNELKLLDNFEFYSLDNSIEDWVKQLLFMKNSAVRYSSDKVLQSFIESGYEIREAANTLEKRFLNEREEISNC
ncbi:glycosyltransferase family 1 protein [Streptococcus gallolyticus]|uniref:Glycosyltransferase involved in cell wall bisynthesis n=1 Tax=Streptococcus gallolyticus TaxID=315405 RepID=A0A1H9QC79_9STRE|nr:glycosyltransferase family 1 protein [Streptococcus gallolyticus]SER58037.1 Glycosyltransferase involved in cell wall bisynthesis [Streptococcus gallolyticus]